MPRQGYPVGGISSCRPKVQIQAQIHPLPSSSDHASFPLSTAPPTSPAITHIHHDPGVSPAFAASPPVLSPTRPRLLKTRDRTFNCTYPNCPHKFIAIGDWKRHENSQHFLIDLWRCEETIGVGIPQLDGAAGNNASLELSHNVATRSSKSPTTAAAISGLIKLIHTIKKAHVLGCDSDNGDVLVATNQGDSGRDGDSATTTTIATTIQDRKGTCYGIFYCRASFVKHLKCDHGVADRSQQECSAQRAYLGRGCETRFWCGFCQAIIAIDVGVDADNPRMCRLDHIGDHYLGVNGPPMTIDQWRGIDADRVDLLTRAS